MDEFVVGFEALASVPAPVAVFGSSRARTGEKTYELAERMGRLLAQRGFTVVTGGGPGVMEAASKGALEVGGLTVGLNIDLRSEQAPNPYLSKLISRLLRPRGLVRQVLRRIRDRPGGFGTLDELFEAVTLVQTRRTPPFPIVLLGVGYWRGLVDWLRDTVAAHAAIGPDELALLRLADTPEEVLAHLALPGQS
jgi:uncharacterized protein (TIGR00730 family)